MLSLITFKRYGNTSLGISRLGVVLSLITFKLANTITTNQDSLGVVLSLITFKQKVRGNGLF